jgi:DNA repair exonuclease SbcCD nuclease subunit
VEREVNPIAITADLHLHEHEQFARERDGFNSRLLDGRDAILRIAETAAERGCRILLFAGDWFHSRRKVSVPVLHVSEETLVRAREEHGIRVVAIPGNHDYSFDEQSCSIVGQPFEDVILEGGVHDVDGWHVGCIPWTDSVEPVRSVLSQRADFYIGHFGIEGARVGPSDFEMPGHIDATVLKRKLTFVGHYHKPQTVHGTNTHYVGSPLQLTWGERGERKSFVVVQPDRTWERIHVKGFPRFMRLSEKSLGKATPRDFVELVVPTRGRVERARHLLDQQYPDHDVHIVTKAEPEDTTPRLNLAGHGLAEQLELYVDSFPLPDGVTKKEALAYGKRLLEGSIA